MSISSTRDDELASLVSAIRGVRRLYSAHPTVVTVAATLVTAAGRAVPAGPLVVSDTAVKVRVGIDDTRSAADVGADVHAAIAAYFRSTASGTAPSIEIEIATFR